jgi:hypothetical protein
MGIVSAQDVKVIFTTAGSLGGAQDADATPAGVLYVNSASDAATVTVASIVTGLYSACATLPSLSAGDCVAMVVSATVSGIAGSGIVFQDVADTHRASDNYGALTSASYGLAALQDYVQNITGDSYGALTSASYGLAALQDYLVDIVADTGTDGVVIATSAITADKFDKSTAFAQSGDAYGEVSSASYGNAALQDYVQNITGDSYGVLTSASYGNAALQDYLVTILDDTAAIGATGSGLTALGDTRIANLDAAISSRAASATALSSDTWTGTRAGYVDYLASASYGLPALQDYVDDLETRLTSTRAGYLDNLDAAISSRSASSVLDTVSTNVDSILADTGTDGVIAASFTTAAKAMINTEVADVLTVDVLADSYASSGSQPTIGQAILAIKQYMEDRAVSSTTVTVYKPGHAASAYTLTLDDASAPASITRAS